MFLQITGAATCYLIILIQFRSTHHIEEAGVGNNTDYM